MHVTIAKDQRTIVEAGPRETPVLEDVDVAVVGGGPPESRRRSPPAGMAPT